MSSNDETADDLLPPQIGTGPVGSAAVTLAAALLGQNLPAAAPVIAGASAGLQTWGRGLQAQIDRRDNDFIRAASRASALSPEDLLRLVAKDGHLTMLAATALDAARRSALREKAAMLGRCVGAMAIDDALIDGEELWIRILERVERPHLKVVRSLFVEHNATMGDGRPLFGKTEPRSVTQVGQSTGLADLALPVIQDLVQVGVLTTVTMQSEGMFELPDGYDLTVEAGPLAFTLLHRLHDATHEAERDSSARREEETGLSNRFP